MAAARHQGVETYLSFAAVQRQQHCQEILLAVDAVKIPNKKKFAPDDVQTVLEDLKAGLFDKLQQVFQKDAQATAGMLNNILNQEQPSTDIGHLQSGKVKTESTISHGAEDQIAARHALKHIQHQQEQLLKRVDDFKSALQRQQQTT